MADQLYPTFSVLLAKVQRLSQDDLDAHEKTVPMNVDDLEDEQWTDTGETLQGKGPNGEDTLFILQKRGSMMRVKPKGRGKRQSKWHQDARARQYGEG